MPLAVALAVFGVFGLVARWRRSVRLGFLCFALFIPLGANAGMGVIDVIFDANSGRQIASQLSALPAGTELACLQCFPNGVPFYLQRTGHAHLPRRRRTDEQLHHLFPEKQSGVAKTNCAAGGF